MDSVVYNGDTRWPGPSAHPPPEHIKGIPTQAELDSYPRMFTWGELKEIVKNGDLEMLMRNKAMQARYDAWMSGIKVQYGSTEKYLTRARLPWNSSSAAAEPEPTYDLSHSPTTSAIPIPVAKLTESTNPDLKVVSGDASIAATPGRSVPGSGANTPSSAGFVSLASLRMVNGKLRRSGRETPLKQGGSDSSTTPPTLTAGSAIDLTSAHSRQSSDIKLHNSGESAQVNGEEADGEEGPEEDEPVYLQFDGTNGLDGEKYAVLPNDWPYNIPYGVRHYCVWSRVPIAHPTLVDYDPDKWKIVESEGLGGFTGITPLRPFKLPPPPANLANPSQLITSHDKNGRQKFIGELEDKDWYAADVAYAGRDMMAWAGVEYTSVGGQEVKKMVEGLWDPRGWECIWFVNPPRLQSVPGFSHFHVFAKRKTPEEIDASEASHA